MNKSTTIKYYSKYIDKNNKTHYTINMYNNIDRTIQSFKDVDFRK